MKKIQSSWEQAHREIKHLLMDFAIAMIKRDFKESNTLHDMNEFILEFMQDRYVEEEEPK